MISSGNTEKGVPDFWLTAMKTNEVLAEEVIKFYKPLSLLSIHHSFGVKDLLLLLLLSMLCVVLIVELCFTVPLVQITERDEEALKHLKDIKWCRIDDPKGFKLEFFFDTNSYFKNSVLTKTYHMIDDDEPILEKAIG